MRWPKLPATSSARDDVLILSLPIVIVIGASVTSGTILRFPPEGFSLRWYAELVEADAFRDAFRRTVYVSLACPAVSVPAGVLAALATVRYRLRFRPAVQVYRLLPFTIPSSCRGSG